jgi:hypothetical protein
MAKLLLMQNIAEPQYYRQNKDVDSMPLRKETIAAIADELALLD